MNLLLLNAFLAIIPVILITAYFIRRDNQKPEPKKQVWKIFVLGFISVIPAIIVGIALNAFTFSQPLFRNLMDAFVTAAFVEEGVKLMVVLFFIYNKPDFDEVTDGIVYTITASLGFACFENLMYSFGSTSTIILRGFTSVPLHAIASGIMGYHIGKARFYPGSWIAKGFFWAILIHGLYDFVLFTGGPIAFTTIPLLIISGFWLLKLTKKALAEDRTAGRS